MKNKILPIVAVVIVIIAICVIVFIPKNKEKDSNTLKTTNTTTTNNTSNKTSKAKTIYAILNDNGDVEIKLDDLETTNATFINYSSNGKKIELVAIKDSQDNIDVAFNTCQVCNGSPKAYFTQKNGKLVCQNCGNAYSLKSIGALADGCNPITIPDSNITKIDGGILISKDYLSQNEKLFVNVANH